MINKSVRVGAIIVPLHLIFNLIMPEFVMVSTYRGSRIQELHLNPACAQWKMILFTHILVSAQRGFLFCLESGIGCVISFYHTSYKFAMLKLHRLEGENSYYHPAIISTITCAALMRIQFVSVRRFISMTETINTHISSHKFLSRLK